ncbi:tonB-dependent receptor plug domain-containing protein [Ditylenchus destructor]|uniref:TonB-dependent receptor plug domain-containing protein n=1 Tax=Ditylenchus destructor TaxID=166010 RepID=A0AAD4MI72_9BILA|nr:tonB-dependent receptor plug domain-containing protein [Ditylenchus destructor]
MVLPSFAWAQDAAEEPEEVIVTGSQIARSGFDTPTPVTVVGTEDFERVAAPNVADALNQYPALKPSVTPEASPNLSKLSSGNYLPLRGLTYLRTLTLVDGKRPTPSPPEGVVNVNNIPQAVISGAEVVTGGPLSRFMVRTPSRGGSISRSPPKLEGVRGNAQYGISNYGDNKSYLASAAGGTKFAGGRGHIIVGAKRGAEQRHPRLWRARMGRLRHHRQPRQHADQHRTDPYPGQSAAKSRTPPMGGLINSATGANGTTLLRGIQFLGNGQTGPLQLRHQPDRQRASGRRRRLRHLRRGAQTALQALGRLWRERVRIRYRRDLLCELRLCAFGHRERAVDHRQRQILRSSATTSSCQPRSARS